MQRCNGNATVLPAHVLLFGPNGCGKTHLVRTMAKLMDVREMLKDVVNAAGGDMERSRHAVVFIDEFDKLAATGSNAREAYQYGTQNGFLTLLDGIFDGSGIDPSGLLFVFAGAFPRLGEIITARISCNRAARPVGFGHEYSAFFEQPGVESALASEAAQQLAHAAHTSGSGARGLKGRLERAIADILFRCPKSNTLHITADILREQGQDYGTVAGT